MISTYNNSLTTKVKKILLAIMTSLIICLPVQAAPTVTGAGCDTVSISGRGTFLLFPEGSGVPNTTADAFQVVNNNTISSLSGGSSSAAGYSVKACFFRTPGEALNPDSTCSLATLEIIGRQGVAYFTMIDVTNLTNCAYTYDIDLDAADVRTNANKITARAPILEFEEPLNGGSSNGIANVRGWIVSDIPVARVDLYVDGALLGEIPYGGARPDIVTAHPTFPNSDKSGFSMAYGYSQLSVGPHSMQVKAYDGASNLLAEKTSAFNLVAFDNDFIGPAAPVNLSGVSFAKPHVLASPIGLKRFRMDDAVLDGVSYDLLFEWNSATQKFEMIEINH